MLKNIYDYSVKQRLVSRPGFKYKKIKAYILLSKHGEFLGFDPAPNKEVFCPDIGSAGQGDKCNVIGEKSTIVFQFKTEAKTAKKISFMKDSLKKAAEYEPLINVVINVLNDKEKMEHIKTIFTDSKYKEGDTLSFNVDGVLLEQSKKYQDWWDIYFADLSKRSDKKSADINLQRCIITGELTQPVRTVPGVSGLAGVGGNTSGDTLICFDKNAFCSYNLQQAKNAALSEQAILSVNVALKNLVADGLTLAGSKFIHWYKEPIPKEADVVDFLKLDFIASDDDGLEGTESSKNFKSESELMFPAKQLIESVRKGENPVQMNNRYYIMNLSAVNGRVMIRSYMEGSYEDLYNNFKTWFDDLKLATSNGYTKPPKLFALYIRLLKNGNTRNMSKQMAGELSNLDTQIKYAIINNTVLPDTIAAKSLAYIKSDMLTADENKKSSNLDAVACQWLKIWLIRKQKYNKEEITMHETLNLQNPSVAYHAGRMMAVFAAIQKEALGDVGAGVVSRYYSSASISPGLVFGRLTNLSNHHLSKIENQAFAHRFSSMLNEIGGKIGNTLPTTFNMQEQTEFALGYYQQNADMFKSNKNNKEEN